MEQRPARKLSNVDPTAVDRVSSKVYFSHLKEGPPKKSAPVYTIFRILSRLYLAVMQPFHLYSAQPIPLMKL